MDKQQVVDELVAVLKEFQTKMGYDDADAVTPSVQPHGGLKGFQSDITPPIARRVAKNLGHQIPDDVDIVNIFVSEDKQRKLTIDESADRFLSRYGHKGATNERSSGAEANHREPPQGGEEASGAYAGAGCDANGAAPAHDLRD
ncbi:hypothetical protein [Tautonia rosea]|uniref:hypothetical protein n=1 Tax=Tautonia rosea TaxID=2728037 RepID=UPI001F2A9FB0|nr:hypothetical protein [Tautonia rosea]